jgi:hypothetical protein
MSRFSPEVQDLLDRVTGLGEGTFALSWSHVIPQTRGTTATPAHTDLTIDDSNIRPQAQIPEGGGSHGSMGLRGCGVPPEAPNLGAYRSRLAGDGRSPAHRCTSQTGLANGSGLMKASLVSESVLRTIIGSPKLRRRQRPNAHPGRGLRP